jgi:hypothetical protein
VSWGILSLTFDTLATAGLGCYGNEWIDTPHWDALAADGIVLDWCVRSDGVRQGFSFSPQPMRGSLQPTPGGAVAKHTVFAAGSAVESSPPVPSRWTACESRSLKSLQQADRANANAVAMAAAGVSEASQAAMSGSGAEQLMVPQSRSHVHHVRLIEAGSIAALELADSSSAPAGDSSSKPGHAADGARSWIADSTGVDRTEVHSHVITGSMGPGVPISEWSFAKLIAAARRQLDELPSGPWVLELQACGLSGAATLPEDLATSYFEDFAERGVDLTRLSAEQLAEHPAVLAAMVSLLDAGFGSLWPRLRSLAADRPLLVCVAARSGHMWERVARRKPVLAGFESQQCLVPGLVWTNRLPGWQTTHDFTRAASARTATERPLASAPELAPVSATGDASASASGMSSDPVRLPDHPMSEPPFPWSGVRVRQPISAAVIERSMGSWCRVMSRDEDESSLAEPARTDGPQPVETAAMPSPQEPHEVAAEVMDDDLWRCVNGTATGPIEPVLMTAGAESWGLWSQADLLLADATLPSPQVQLFEWPDDPWLVNDLASTRAELVAARLEELRTRVSALRAAPPE